MSSVVLQCSDSFIAVIHQIRECIFVYIKICVVIYCINSVDRLALYGMDNTKDAVRLDDSGSILPSIPFQ